MSCCGLHSSLFVLLWIFILQRAAEALPTPVDKLSDQNKVLQHVTNTKNLSELIEYVPLGFPYGTANMTVSSEIQEEASGTKVSTFKLKTFLHVKNNNVSRLDREPKQSESSTSAVFQSAKLGNAAFGLSLDRQSWNKRTFIRSKIEPNKTRWSLDGVEYVPGEVLSDISEMLRYAPNASVNNTRGTEPLSQGQKENKEVSLSLEDGGWNKKPFARGIVEQNGTKTSLRDIQYVPGEISDDIPASWYNIWQDHKELDKNKPEENDRYGTSKDSTDWSTSALDNYGSEFRKSSRVGDHTDDKHGGQSSDSSEELEEYWFGPGKVEKLHYNHGGKAWREFPERQILASRRFYPSKAASDRRAREIEYGSLDENIPETLSDEVTESLEVDYQSRENHSRKIFAKDTKRSRDARPRQFVFHPYLPYGKEPPADEKIKFSDILPIRMVKFVKSMVEEAPWEQMFIKMVRMVVDQFVDKIIEKMFADKGDEHLKRRSIDGFLGDSWRFPAFVATPFVRTRRSVDADKHPQELDDWFYPVHSRRDPQNLDSEEKKPEGDDKSWLDLFLDYIFPNSKSERLEDSYSERLTKRDTNNVHMFRVLVSFFLNYFEKTSEALTDAKDTLRYKMLKDILPYLYQKRFAKKETAENSPNSLESLKMSPRDLLDEIRNRYKASDRASHRVVRKKRSTEDDDAKRDEIRLWQDGSRRHKPHHRRVKNDCSLRRACNTGRFLSRLPAVEEITMQLKSQGNEPHWDAMIWGMKKKRCSRIFCKRQRSPKGSHHPWLEDRGQSSARMLEIVTEQPNLVDSAANIAR